MGSKESPWQRPIFISGVPGGTRVISLNFEIDNVKLDPLPDDLLEAVSDFLEKVEKNTPSCCGLFVYSKPAYIYTLSLKDLRQKSGTGNI